MIQKMRKIAFSRLFVVGMAIVMQLALFFIMLSNLNEYSTIFNTVMRIVSFMVIVSIINRNMVVEAKIPWIIIVLLLPLFGTAMYLAFSEYRMSKKQRKLFLQINDNIVKNFEVEISQRHSILEDAGKYTGLCNYIINTTLHLPYKNTSTKFYADGSLFFDDLLKELSGAKKFIFMEYFIIAGGYMWDCLLDVLIEKIKQGVEVRIMYDDLGSVSTLKYNFDSRLSSMGIKCIKFHPFIPIVSEAHNNRDHRKITVIDGKCAFIGGANIADEYINKNNRIDGYWKDSAIKIEGHAVKAVTAMFVHMYTTQLGKADDYTSYLCCGKDCTDEKGIVIPFGDGPRPAYTEHVSENVILSIINRADKYIWITTPYLIIDDKLTNALCAAALRGVDVKIVTPHIPDKKIIFAITHSYYQRLQDKGVKIFEFTPGFIHSKQIVCDDQIAVVGTVNLDYRSLVHHYECGVVLIGTDTVADIKNDFCNIFKCSADMDGFKQNKFVSMLCSFCSAFTPLL